MENTNDKAVQAAITYLQSRKALHKLATPVLVIGRNLCIYSPKKGMPTIGKP